jgi:hypothetical protein
MGLLFGVIWNLNPLLKYDGYFSSDVLKSPASRKSMRYVTIQRRFQR